VSADGAKSRSAGQRSPGSCRCRKPCWIT
jgi:hypothetical protein